MSVVIEYDEINDLLSHILPRFLKDQSPLMLRTCLYLSWEYLLLNLN